MDLIKILLRQFYSIMLVTLFVNVLKADQKSNNDEIQIVQQTQILEKKTRKRIGILSLPIKHHFSETIEGKINETQNETSQKILDDVLELQNNASYYPESYTKWLQLSADSELEIVPLEYYSVNAQNIPQILDNLDAILLTGGGTNLYEKVISSKQHNDLGLISKTAIRIYSDYTKKVAAILKKAEQINQQGRVFPVWGTCLGFESMLVYYAEKDFKFKDIKNFKNNAQVQIIEQDDLQDNMFNIFNQQEKQKIQQMGIHFFNHMQNTLFQDIQRDNKFNEEMYLTATSITKGTGQVILAAFQSKNYPFYAVQFHPEKAGNEKYSGVVSDELHKQINLKYSQFFLSKVHARQYQTQYNILEQFKKNQLLLKDIGHFEKISLFVPRQLLE